MPSKKPTIKGMFVQSHIETLRKAKGDKAVATLEERFGRPAYFKRLEDVSTKDEATLIELVYDLIHEGHGLTGTARDRAVGRLHFANFSETTFGSMLMASMPHTKATLRTMLINIGTISRSVIKHTTFSAEEVHLGICVRMSNSDYPPEHFAGFFEEWLAQWNLRGVVACSVKSQRAHEYVITM